MQFYSTGDRPELAAAKQALSPTRKPKRDSAAESPREEAQLLPPWSVPSHLITNPSDGFLRDAVALAVQSGKLAHSNQDDIPHLLQFGLHLQELAARLATAATEDQLTLLHQACDIYDRANTLKQGTHAAILFNWAVALSDISRISRSSNMPHAIECLITAADKYSASLAVDPSNPQALNNWALVLNDLQTLLPVEAHGPLVPQSVARFRAAIRLLPEPDTLARFSYNLGTVLYASACALQEQRSIAFGEDKRVRTAFAHAAQYIVLSYALHPKVGASEESLQAVQRLLPLPHLRSGPLLTVSPGTEGTPHESWVKGWFALDVHNMQCVRPPAIEMGKYPGPVPEVLIDMNDVSDVQLCADPSLPSGHGIWLATQSKPLGIFLVAEDEDDAEGWVDALTLLLQVKRTEAQKERLQTALLARRLR